MMKRNFCTLTKVVIYTFALVQAIVVCASDKSVLAKVMLSADFALIALMGDCLTERPRKKRRYQDTNKRVA